MADSKWNNTYPREEGNAPSQPSRRSRWDRPSDKADPPPHQPKDTDLYSQLQQGHYPRESDRSYSKLGQYNYGDTTEYADQWRTPSSHDLVTGPRTVQASGTVWGQGGHQAVSDRSGGPSGGNQKHGSYQGAEGSDTSLSPSVSGRSDVQDDRGDHQDERRYQSHDNLDGQPIAVRRFSDSEEAQKRKFTEAFAATYGHHSDSDDSDADNPPSEPSSEPSPKKAAGFAMTMGRSSAQVAAPQPMKAIGFSMAMNKTAGHKVSGSALAPANISKKPVAPIKMSLGVQKQKAPQSLKKPAALANVFNESDDSDEDEMPAEAKMRMRNLGRETPTAAGPNSFGKGRLGFCDRQKIIQRELQKKMDEVGTVPKEGT